MSTAYSKQPVCRDDMRPQIIVGHGHSYVSYSLIIHRVKWIVHHFAFCFSVSLRSPVTRTQIDAYTKNTTQ